MVGPSPPGAENRLNPKVPETLESPAKTLILMKSCRSVPPTPGTPRAERESRFTSTQTKARFLHHRATPTTRPWSGLTGVVNSLKLSQGGGAGQLIPGNFPEPRFLGVPGGKPGIAAISLIAVGGSSRRVGGPGL